MFQRRELLCLPPTPPPYSQLLFPWPQLQEKLSLVSVTLGEMGL